MTINDFDFGDSGDAETVAYTNYPQFSLSGRTKMTLNTRFWTLIRETTDATMAAVIEHETLHDVIRRLEGDDASVALDNITKVREN